MKVSLNLHLLKLKVLLLLVVHSSKGQFWPEYNSFNETGIDRVFSCSTDKKCIKLHNCPELLNLMQQQALPISRLRSSICGYTESSLKVCCDPLARSVDAISDPESSPYPVWNLQCGQTLIKSNVETLGSYPFVVLVSFVNTASRAVIYPCLGTIINERSILTTATCALANYANFQLHSVVVGDFDISMDPDCNALFCSHKARHYPISHVIKYPSFESITYTNNIALLRLTTSIEFTVTAQPICLPPAEFIVRDGKSGTVVGWGKLSFQRDMSSIQQILRMKLMPLQECSQYTKRGLSVELCARGEEPCSGFSGAPFFSREGDNYFLIGIVSHGSDCEDQQSDPTVFVDVQKYTDWIRNNF